MSEGAETGLVTWFWVEVWVVVVVAVLPNKDKLDLLVSPKEKPDFVVSPDTEGLLGGVGWPNMEVGLLAPNKESGSVFAGCSAAPASSISSIDSVGGLGLLGDETISSNEPPKEKAPEEGLSDLGRSLAAEPSPLKDDSRTKPPEAVPKGFCTSFDLGAKAVSVDGLAPNGEAPDAFPNALSPVDAFANGDSPAGAFANGDSPGLAAAKLLKPPPVPVEKELNPPPEVPAPVPRRLLPGVLGCPNVDPILPNPDWPNCGWPALLGVPNDGPGCEGAPNEGPGDDGFPNDGAEPPAREEGLPNEGADGLPNAVAPIVEAPMFDGDPNVVPAGFPNADAPKGEGLPKDD